MIVSSSLFLFLFLFYFHFSLQQNMKVSFVQADNGEREREACFPFLLYFWQDVNICCTCLTIQCFRAAYSIISTSKTIVD